MHGPINVKSPNNTSKWQMGFNSVFKGLKDDTKKALYTRLLRRYQGSEQNVWVLW